MKYFHKLLSISLILLSSGYVASAQNIIYELDTLVTAWASVAKYNGTAMVIKGDDTLLMKGYGPKDVNRQYACDANTIYKIGQLTELFTSTLIFKLQEDHLLSVDDKVSKYYPDYPHSDKITIKHLLTNTAGIPDYTLDDSFFNAGISAPRSRNDVLNAFYYKPLKFKPGSKYEKSASNYAMLGYIIEKVTDEKYYNAIREILFNKIGTQHTGFDFGGYASWDKAKGYQVLNQFRVLRTIPVDSTVGYASSGMFSTVRDVALLANACINEKYLSPKSWDAATTKFKDDYTCGWQIKNIYDKKALWHIGVTPGYVCNLLVVPEDSITVIIMSNDMESEVNLIQEDILAALYEKPYDLPQPKPLMRMSDRLLKDYEGRFELPDGRNINFFIKSGLLYGQITGQVEFTLMAEKIDKFYIQPVDMEFTFIRNEDNDITDVIIRHNRENIKAHKWQ